MLELYNSPENLHGTRVAVLIASQVLTEGYTLRAVRHEVFASPPLDIAEFLQVLGRVFRYGVHADLPEDERTVELHVYAYRGLLDERIYRALMHQYEAISRLMRELHRGAADAALFHPRLFPDLTHYFGTARESDNPGPPPHKSLPDYARLSQRFPENKARRDFGPLFFWPRQTHVPKSVARDQMHIRQFDLEERRILEYRVRRELVVQPVWNADELWERVREPLMDRGNFEVVIRGLAFDRARPLAPPVEPQRTLVRVRENFLVMLPFVGQTLEAGQGMALPRDCWCDPTLVEQRGMAAGAAGANLLLAPESYLQTRPPAGRQEMTLEELREETQRASFPEEVERARVRLTRAISDLRDRSLQRRLEEWADLAFEIPPRVHQELIRNGVDAAWEGVRAGRAPGDARVQRDFPLFEFYRFFRMVLLANELDRGARAAAELPRDTPRNTPVGYRISDASGASTWWLYAPPDAANPQGRWIEHPHLGTSVPDNPVIFGFREGGVFKLRSPGAATRRQPTDLRKRERGMACFSYGLDRLRPLVRRLRLALADYPQARAALPDTDALAELCMGIRRALILAEARGGGRKRWFSFGA